MAPTPLFRAQLAKANPRNRKKKGDTAAQSFIFKCYAFGEEGVTKDEAAGFKYCRMAAEGGHTPSQICMASAYVHGRCGVERDERKATAWFLRAAKDGGDPAAQYHTALRFGEGKGHDAPNATEAFRWFQAAANQGHIFAQHCLGNFYEQGVGVPKNEALALEAWRKCAQQEIGDAEESMQSCYGSTGCPCGCQARASSWACKAWGSTRACKANAHYRIGNCYSHGGNGVNKDLAMAMQWWTKGEEQGCIISRVAIGEIHVMGCVAEERVPFDAFDRDVPLGMKHLKAVAALRGGKEYKELDPAEGHAVRVAEGMILTFSENKPCVGCGRTEARKLCSGCLNADRTNKVRYCGEACQLVHWRHRTAPHIAECGCPPVTYTAAQRREFLARMNRVGQGTL
jgi:TPR repeat protein